jgi:two-component system chemotaxis sensor kinase CheA
MAEVPTTDAELLDLLCRPGLSTREEVTTTSGRGMGMDIVRRVVVDQLGGELRLSTRPGIGTSFSLHVPLTIAIVDAFTTQCGSERFVVPVSMVEEIVEIDESRVVSASLGRVGGGPATQLGMFERRGEAVPLVNLAALLRIPHDATVARKALVVRRNGQPIAFVLDRVLGQQEAVVRPLLDPLVNVPGVSGATDLGDGRPTLVLDLVALAVTRPAKLLQAPPSAPALPARSG